MADESSREFDEQIRKAAAKRRVRRKPSNEGEWQRIPLSEVLHEGEAWRRAMLLGAAIAVRNGNPLSEDQQRAVADAAIDWLRKKWGDHACPYCDHVQWEVGSTLSVRLETGETMSPAVPVMCGNCGQTTLVNAIRAGIVPEVE
jgi:hypothetical protein